MRRVCFFVAAFFLVPSLASAQPNAAGTLAVTVVDSSGAVLPGATITVTGLDPNNKSATIAPVKTGTDGVATLPKLPPGRYAVQADFDGFETRRLPEVRVRNGNNKQVMMLPIAGHKESVTVGQDRQSAAADPRGSSFGSTLTREQLEALSDDPDALRQQLLDMAGPGAVIKVDSFEGGALPHKSQIRSIRISRDQFAAEHHAAGGINIEIITQPGLGPVRMNFGARIRGDGLTGRSPFVPERGPEQFRNVFVGGGGTLIKNKASFNAFFNGTDSYETPNINIVTGPGEHRSEAMGVRAPRDNYNFNANVDYAATIDHTLRFGFGISGVNNRNLGIGQWDEVGRAYAMDSTNGFFRAQQIGPLGRRAFLRTRLQVAWTGTTNTAALEARTIRVHDAFTTGGAQVSGGQRARTGVFAGDLDYVRGLHTIRTGVQVDASRWRSDDASNYLGTYTFESLAAYELGRPRSFTQRIGDPNLQYENVQGAFYAQDDIRVRRNLTLSAGLRYEAQNLMDDYDNVMPRFGITWAPGTAGRTTLRASWGIFHDWFATNTYEQTLRVDGIHQQEIDIADPPYPDFNDFVLLAAPGNRYVLGDNVSLPRSTRLSLGLDQRWRGLQAAFTYAYIRGGGIARGNNRNAPVDGARPNPQFGNIIEVLSDASSRQHQLQTNLTVNPGALFPLGKSAPRINARRVTLFLNHTIGESRSNSDGAFGIPPLGDLELEWGPANNDVRQRINISLNNQIVKNFRVGLNINANSGVPYTIRTGRDDNGDLVFNDRPGGLGRNTERADAHFTVNLNVGYEWTFGPPVAGPPGIGVFVSGGQANVQTFEQPSRYRIGFFVNAQNLTNRANYTGYSGTMTSPFFRQATSVAATRRVEGGFNFGF